MKVANEQNNKHAKPQSENKENINIIINSSSFGANKKSSKSTETKFITSLLDKPLASKS
jgi:hypothetical protein